MTRWQTLDNMKGTIARNGRTWMARFCLAQGARIEGGSARIGVRQPKAFTTGTTNSNSKLYHHAAALSKGPLGAGGNCRRGEIGETNTMNGGNKNRGGALLGAFSSAVTQSQSRGMALLPPKDLPLGKLEKKWKKKKNTQKILDEWGGEWPPPTLSPNPEIFAAQQRVFGYKDYVEGRSFEKKWKKNAQRAEAVTSYYLPRVFDFKRSVMTDLKFKKSLAKKTGSEEDMKNIDQLLDVFRYTPDQLRRKKKLVLLKRRGKGPPKKGQGKRKK